MKNQTIDFDGLALKTSNELVSVIKKDLTNYKGEARNIQAFEIEEHKNTNYETIAIYMIADDICFKYFYSSDSDDYSRQMMGLYALDKFLKMSQSGEEKII